MPFYDSRHVTWGKGHQDDWWGEAGWRVAEWEWPINGWTSSKEWIGNKFNSWTDQNWWKRSKHGKSGAGWYWVTSEKGWNGGHGKGGKGWKGGKAWKGDKGWKGGKGWNDIFGDVSAYSTDNLSVEGSLGHGSMGQCFHGTYRTELSLMPVAIKPASNSCETAILRRILEADPPLTCVVPVLLVQHGTPAGGVNVTALGSLGTLASILKRGQPRLSVAGFLAFVASIAEGLASLHAKQIIHSDLKPDNVVLHVSDAGDVCVWLIDFGDGRLLDDSSSWFTQGWGAPEIQCEPDNRSGNYSSRTDSWCLAQCAAWLWDGGPHWLSNPAWLQRDMPLHDELQKCLSWEPHQRPESAQIAHAANLALEEMGTTVREELKNFWQSM
mmetsp:Transcript_89971/g.155833  ORF Transcript_89971/g.155833 Transcript_89971/m.155833 type:complete len:382 (+) Transcript_89971:81-1226(+)